MLKSANLSFTTWRKNILMFGLLNCLLFIGFLMIFKFTPLLHVWGMRMVTYLIFAAMSLVQIHGIIKRARAFVPFLQTFFVILFTGMLAYVLFAGFLFGYSFADPYVTNLFIDNSSPDRLYPAALLLFEGGGGSIVIALIVMFYSGRYEDGETSET